MTIPSLAVYMLVEQESAAAVVFRLGYAVSTICDELAIPPTTFYRWQKRRLGVIVAVLPGIKCDGRLALIAQILDVPVNGARCDFQFKSHNDSLRKAVDQAQVARVLNKLAELSLKGKAIMAEIFRPTRLPN